MKWVKLLFLGDSLTTGAREPFGMSWPYYLAHAALRDGVIVLPEVEAVNGSRSSDLVRTAIGALQRADAREAFILIGTNDAKDVRGGSAVPVEITVANVQLVAAWCDALDVRPYVMTVPLPSGFGSPGYTSEVVGRIRAINNGLRAAGLVRIIECEDIRETVDGIHLSASAARVVATRAWNAIKETRTFL